MRKSNAASTQIKNRSENIVLITEPTVAGGKISNLSRQNTQLYAHVGRGRDDAPRAALRVGKDLNPWLVAEYTNRDMCVVAVKIESQLTYLCSLYLDITIDPKNPLFEQLVDVCNRERIPLVVGMDSNSHSPLWGCPDKNERGEALEDIFLSKN